MTQEDKQLLLKDLCARLPYGVKILHEGWNYEWDDDLSTVERVVGIDEKFIYTKVIDTHNGEEYKDDKWPIDTFDDKLYLRSMSSMTKEEKAKYYKLITRCQYDSDAYFHDNNNRLYDWLNEHHFDYRGLIEKGLALEAPEDMYKEE